MTGTMTLRQAMSRRDAPDPRDPNPACETALIDPNRYFAGDVTWVAFTCPACRVRIATVGGGPHWWNAVVTPSPSAAERIAALPRG